MTSIASSSLTDSDGHRERNELAAQVALALALSGVVVSLFVAGFLAAYPAFIKFSPTVLAPLAVPFRLGKTLEFVIYIATYTALLPTSIWVAGSFARRLNRRPGSLSALAVANLLGLATILAAARVILTQAPPILSSDRQHWVRPLSMAVFVALVLLVVADLVAWRHPPHVSVPAKRQQAAMALALLVTGAVFLPRYAYTTPSVVIAAVAALAAFAAFALSRWHVPALPMSSKLVKVRDGIAIVIVALLAWNVRMPTGEALAQNAHYWNVYVGPANALLHGGTMFVDIFAQYGAGTYYFFAGIFGLTTPGYGTFVITVAAVDTALFVASYVMLRLGGASRLLSSLVVAAAILTSILPDDTLITNRGLRLLLPVLGIICVQMRERRPSRVLWSWLGAVVVGISSIVAAEVFFYTLVAVLAGLFVSFRLARPGRGIAVDRGALGRLVAAFVVAQIVFNVATRVAAGAWPKWITYLEFQHYYVSGAGSRATAPFSQGVLLGIGYFVSAAAALVILTSARRFAERHAVEMVSIGALAAGSIAYFSYMIGEAYPTNVHKMAPIGLLLLGLWLGLLARDYGPTARQFAPWIAFGSAWVLALTLFSARSWLDTHIAHSALYMPNVISDIQRDAREPVATPESASTEAFIRQTLGADKALLVLLPDHVLPTEMLVRLKKGPLLPISDPYEESFIPSRRRYLTRLAERLPLGTRFVTTEDYLASSEPNAQDLDAQILAGMKQRFKIVTVVVGPARLRVYRLAARS